MTNRSIDIKGVVESDNRIIAFFDYPNVNDEVRDPIDLIDLLPEEYRRDGTPIHLEISISVKYPEGKPGPDYFKVL